jgi:hypothetical protein
MANRPVIDFWLGISSGNVKLYSSYPPVVNAKIGLTGSQFRHHRRYPCSIDHFERA